MVNAPTPARRVRKSLHCLGQDKIDQCQVRDHPLICTKIFANQSYAEVIDLLKDSHVFNKLSIFSGKPHIKSSPVGRTNLCPLCRTSRRVDQSARRQDGLCRKYDRAGFPRVNRCSCQASGASKQPDLVL